MKMTIKTGDNVLVIAGKDAGKTGEILEVNAALEDAPELVNNDPYGEGWMIKIAVKDAAELNDLMDAEAYAAFIGK